MMTIKTLLLINALFFLTQNVFAQDTTYYAENDVRVNSLAEASYYQIKQSHDSGIVKEIIRTFYKSGQLRSEGQYSDTSGISCEGVYKLYYSDGQTHENIGYKSGKFNGPLLTYWENGKPKRIDNYRNGDFVSGKCFDSLGRPTAHTIFEQMPVFPGGEAGLMQFLQSEIRYPNKARKKGIQGKVVIRFIVNADGSVSDVKIIQSVNNALDEEAERVIKRMPRWKPGIHDGKEVNVSYEMPIEFKLE